MVCDGIRIPDCTKIFSDSLDITTLSEPWLFNISEIRVLSFTVILLIRWYVRIGYFLSLYGVLTRRQYNIPILDINETSIEYQSWAPESVTCKDFDMKNKTLFRIASIQILILLLFMFLTLGNEILDIPHYVLNDPPTFGKIHN